MAGDAAAAFTLSGSHPHSTTCFTMHGTDADGNKFKVEFHLDSGAAFEMATEFAYDHPDNPRNQLKED